MITHRTLPALIGTARSGQDRRRRPDRGSLNSIPPLLLVGATFERSVLCVNATCDTQIASNCVPYRLWHWCLTLHAVIPPPHSPPYTARCNSLPYTARCNSLQSDRWVLKYKLVPEHRPLCARASLCSQIPPIPTHVNHP